MFDELGSLDQPRDPYMEISNWIKEAGFDALTLKNKEAETLFRKIGITFAVYGNEADTERLIPFDLIPRAFSASEWDTLSKGIEQRTRALNAFLYDVYHDCEIVKEGILPKELVFENSSYLPEMVGFDPPGKVYSHIVGVDLVRTGAKDFFVLEDNCRTPSGVSYMLENREIMMRMFPDLFSASRIKPVDHYADLLRKSLEEVAPKNCKGQPNLVVLTPGPYNSAYYEHSFLSDQLAVDLVEPADLYVDEGFVYKRTTRGPERVDVIYRRIDDEYIDPLIFNPNSVLGVAGIFNAYRAGNVTLCSAPGAGLADDKAIYCFMPDIIKYYFNEEPLLNNVTSYRCSIEDELNYVLDHIDQLVVKEVHGSGGYGMLVGPKASASEIEKFTQILKKNPGNYIAQPTLDLSACPCLINKEIVPRHVDFRPFALMGKKVRLTPGGLTRVALTEGSLVVNSSQGGGVKDTWVLAE